MLCTDTHLPYSHPFFGGFVFLSISSWHGKPLMLPFKVFFMCRVFIQMKGFINQSKKNHFSCAAFKECILYPYIEGLVSKEVVNTLLPHLEVITYELVASPLLQNNPGLKVKGR